MARTNPKRVHSEIFEAAREDSFADMKLTILFRREKVASEAYVGCSGAWVRLSSKDISIRSHTPTQAVETDVQIEMASSAEATAEASVGKEDVVKIGAGVTHGSGTTVTLDYEAVEEPTIESSLDLDQSGVEWTLSLDRANRLLRPYLRGRKELDVAADCALSSVMVMVEIEPTGRILMTSDFKQLSQLQKVGLWAKLLGEGKELPSFERATLYRFV